MAISIGIDLGGTRIKGVALDEGNHIVHQLYTPTNDGDDQLWKAAVSDTVNSLQSVAGPAEVVGISAPGISNRSNTAIACMPGRLQGLEGFDWTAYLQKPCFVLNDAIAALVAEARMGAAVGRKNIALLTLGTGVGGAILIDGKPYQGSFHKAGHIGHMTVDANGEPDVTGMPGSLEDAIGNCTIESRSKGRYKSTHDLLKDYREGNEFASEIWLNSVRRLAVGIASISNILSPEAVILGGGITEAGKELFEPLEKYLDQFEWRPGGEKTLLIKAKFGDMAGAIGAACFAREMKLEQETPAVKTKIEQA